MTDKLKIDHKTHAAEYENGGEAIDIYSGMPLRNLAWEILRILDRLQKRIDALEEAVKQNGEQ